MTLWEKWKMKFFKEMNLPNKLTCVRMVLIIPFVIFVLAGKCEGTYKWLALATFAIASFTDFLDGKIARSRGLVTDFGKFMDPLADKVLVCGALICMIELGRVPAWYVIIVIAREFIISGFRLVAADNGIVIAASMWGKVKTACLMVEIIFLILGFESGIGWYITQALLYICAALVIISMCDYIWKNRQIFANQK